ncbi:DUF6777 domain-containing protein [Streptomyces sp. HUAS TT20]|uniref:DUF6777 domain-containing protein n=1 Tax=Streptomyces sp. HUAS TT20 TaxID=3447509 RepID=UPI0021D83A72|nr:DUF6777 domain-containing protein [Streptomyces sp. HUAS 15-9]UXY31327.1 hypothetical protein N8I87_35500 [Streptomyces sp. HUAS 15-9]
MKQTIVHELSRLMWENVVRIPTGTAVMAPLACLLAAALLVVGCARDGIRVTGPSGEVFLQPVAVQGPDPFTGSTATGGPDSADQFTRAAQSGGRIGNISVTGSGVRSVSGGTPGLYGGTARVGSCDVERQIGYLAADPARGSAFARAEGITRKAVPGYLRGLTPVVLRADTRVTNHGFRDGRAAGFQSVLQAGTAVLVDDRGVPRVRCACGNPLKPPTATHSGSGIGGHVWSGYRPGEVIEVTPAPHAVTSITIIDLGSHAWIERPIGHDVQHDHVVHPPVSATQPSRTQRPKPHEHENRPSASPGESGRAPVTAPSAVPSGCATPTSTRRPDSGGASAPVAADVGGTVAPVRPQAPGCATRTPTATVPGTQQAPVGGRPTPGIAKPSTDSTRSAASPDTADETGPGTVPDVPDLSDGGGLVPDDGTTVTGSIFDSPTGVVGG